MKLRIENCELEGTMAFKAVLFDLDGTLLNTLEDIADSMNAALAMHGFPGHDLTTYKILVGDGMDVLTQRALPEARRDEATVEKCLAGMRSEYGRRWAVKTHLYAGMAELLDGLTARKVRMAVLSNKPDDFTKAMVAKLLPRWRFECVYGARAGVAKKPDPGPAIEVAREMGLSPGEFLYLGDTNIDMRTAVGAGMHALGAVWGFRPAKELAESGAKALVEKPLDVLAFIS